MLYLSGGEVSPEGVALEQRLEGTLLGLWKS